MPYAILPSLTLVQLALIIVVWIALWACLLWSLLRGQTGIARWKFERRDNPIGYWACVAFNVWLMIMWPYLILSDYHNPFSN
jgi:hypothetical protein